MKEILTANSVNYTVEDIQTGIDTISFKIVNPVPDDVEATFRDVKALTVGGTEGEVYGEYSGIEYESVTIDADGTITVTMHIPTKVERQIKELQAAVSDHDEAIAQILYGGGGK